MCPLLSNTQSMPPGLLKSYVKPLLWFNQTAQVNKVETDKAWHGGITCIVSYYRRHSPANLHGIMLPFFKSVLQLDNGLFVKRMVALAFDMTFVRALGKARSEHDIFAHGYMHNYIIVT